MMFSVSIFSQHLMPLNQFYFLKFAEELIRNLHPRYHSVAQTIISSMLMQKTFGVNSLEIFVFRVPLELFLFRVPLELFLSHQYSYMQMIISARNRSCIFRFYFQCYILSYTTFNNSLLLLWLQNSNQENEANGSTKLGESKNGTYLSLWCQISLTYADFKCNHFGYLTVDYDMVTI